MDMPILSLAILMPAVGSILIAFLPHDQLKWHRTAALIFSLVTLVIVGIMGLQADLSSPKIQLEEIAQWLPQYGVSYHLGIDGLSYPLVFLSALLTSLAVLASWSVEYRAKAYFSLLMLLEAGLIGVFLALDYILFYIFWEVVLVPMYFLIGIWGGPRKEYAALKFFVYTLFGSVIMLVGILALYFGAGINSFSMLDLAQVTYGRTLQFWVFLAFFIGLAVKVPVFPFHTWLPDAHVEAPTAVSMLLAGVLLKMGAYGFFRFMIPTLPEAMQLFAPILGILGVINIVYGALAAMAQDDLKKMVAYSSISHMGFVLLGVAALTPAAVNGAVFQMFSHGVISALLFYAVGLIYTRTHTRQISELGGVLVKIPAVGVILAIAAFASLGLPGFSGFIAEFFVLLGTFTALRPLVFLAGLGMILTAGYLLWMMQRVLLGQSPVDWPQYADVRGRELVVAAPLILAAIVLGVYPALLINLTSPAVSGILALLGGN